MRTTWNVCGWTVAAAVLLAATATAAPAPPDTLHKQALALNDITGEDAALGKIFELLEDAQFLFEDRPMIEEALDAFTHANADFPDHLIGLLAERAGALTTYTFDKKAAKLPGFTFLK